LKYSIHDLKKHFNIRREEAALLFIFLTLLPPHSSLDFLNGKIEKLTEDTFRLCIDSTVLHKVAEGFLSGTVRDEYDEVFSERPDREDK
jgi:hypothetical protein